MIRKLRYVLMGCALTAAAMIIAAVILLEVVSRRHDAAFLRVEQHLRDHRAELHAAVLEVIAAEHDGPYFGPKLLPRALAAPGVRGAMAGDRHVTLIVYSNPDVDRGFRVWAGTPTANYVDTPTDISNVFRFRYCNDEPESDSNRPD